jgi:hypothetical protein
MITLVGEDRRGLVDELVARFDTVTRETAPAAVCLSAPMGWGKTRVIQEFYARLAQRQQTPAYWPAHIVSADADNRLERERKRIVPMLDRTPPGAQMPWLWWGISCQRRQDGRLLPAALVDRAQVQTHLSPLLQRLAQRHKDRELSIELVATFVGLVLPDVIDLGLAMREVPTWLTEKISR